MAVGIGAIAADFEQDSTLGRIRFHQWADAGWVLVLSCPTSFSEISQADLGAAARLAPLFAARRLKVLAHSRDSLAHHVGWLAAIETAQNVSVEFPILADQDGAAAHALGLAANGGAEGRAAMLIDPMRRVRAILAYPAEAGLNFDEVLRVVDAANAAANQS